VPAPNDPSWSSQWGPDAIGARGAWAITRGRPEIVVAVLDSGVDLTHPDLRGRLVPGIDTGSGDNDPTDEDGHGTHVAGIIAAASNNGLGVSGVAPGVVLMPVKVMDDDGNIWDSAVAEGIAWAVARGARVVNMSLGGTSDSAAIDAAIDDARAKGVVVVAAAGNHAEGGLATAVEEPAAYGPVLAVAAVGDGGDALGPPGTAARYTHASYSNGGPEVDISAPGTSILSTVPTWESSDYRRMSGTSMATPFVSAAAALVLSRDPSLTADQVEAALLATAVDLGPPGPDPETGAGLVRADAAVASIAAPASDGVAPVVRVSGIADGTVVRGSAALTFAATDASPLVAVRVYRDGSYLQVRRRASVDVAWNSRTVRDGLRSWTAYATDAGLQVGSASARVLVANGRAISSVAVSLAMTATARSIGRAVVLRVTGPFVARVRGPSTTSLVVSLVAGSGRVVATARGAGSAALALASVAAGGYTLRASATVAVAGATLRLSAGWFR
jgi:subtilisin family serine protease